MSTNVNLNRLVAMLAMSTAIIAVSGVRNAQAYSLVGNAGLAGDAYWISLMCGGTKAAKAAGSTIDWYPVKTTNASEMNANFEAMKIANPDGIVWSEFGNALPPVGWIDSLMNAGVPVVAVNDIPPDPSYRKYLRLYRAAPATNRMEAVADDIIKQTGGTGSMTIMGGLAGLGPDFEARWTGLVDILKKKAPNLTITDVQRSGFDANKANDMTSAMIVSTPDLKVVYTSSGPEGQGAGAAVKAAGKTGKVLVYSFDAVPALQDLLRGGTVKMLIAQPPGLEGEMAVKDIISYLDAHKTKGPVAPDIASQDKQIPTMLITMDNIDSPEAAGYLYKDTCQ